MNAHTKRRPRQAVSVSWSRRFRRWRVRVPTAFWLWPNQFGAWSYARDWARARWMHSDPAQSATAVLYSKDGRVRAIRHYPRRRKE